MYSVPLETICCKSFDDVRFDLGPFLQGQTRASQHKTAYIWQISLTKYFYVEFMKKMINLLILFFYQTLILLPLAWVFITLYVVGGAAAPTVVPQKSTAVRQPVLEAVALLLVLAIGLLSMVKKCKKKRTKKRPKLDTTNGMLLFIYIK